MSNTRMFFLHIYQVTHWPFVAFFFNFTTTLKFKITTHIRNTHNTVCVLPVWPLTVEFQFVSEPGAASYVASTS